MYVSENWSDNSSVDCSAKSATSYENRGDGYQDYTDPKTVWVQLRSGADCISIRMTWKQMDGLSRQLEAHIKDLEVRDGTPA